jgi:probable rRNA maturation factor
MWEGSVPSHFFLNDVIQIDRPTDEISQRALSLFATKAMQTIGLKGELSVRITSNRQMQELNRRFRRKDKSTDVLSFPASVAGTVGDIAISKDIAAANAKKLGHPLTTELKVLILHGLLHLAGYDHEGDDGEMTARESQLRKDMGLPLGLIERTNGSSRPIEERVPRFARDDKPKKRVGKKRGGRRA